MLQWNVRSLISNLDDVQELLYELSPKVLCMQQTHLNSKHTNILHHYAVFRKDHDDGAVASGGVAIIQ